MRSRRVKALLVLAVGVGLGAIAWQWALGQQGAKSDSVPKDRPPSPPSQAVPAPPPSPSPATTAQSPQPVPVTRRVAEVVNVPGSDKPVQVMREVVESTNAAGADRPMLIERLPDEYSALVKQYNEAKDERTKFEISYKLTELTVKRVAEAAEQRKRAIDEYNKAHPTNPITSANDLPSYAPYSPPKRAAERPSQYVPALPPAPWYTAVPYSPSMVQIADQVPGLVRQYADAKDDKAKSEARSRLADVLGKQFAQQQAQQKQQIDQLQAQLKRLQELMSKRESACKQIVDQRIDQLLRDAEGLGWLPTAPGVTVPVYNRYAPYPVLPVVPETRATTIPANPSAVEAKPKENVPPPVSIPAPGR